VLAMFISFCFMMFICMFTALGFVGGALLMFVTYVFLTKVLKFKEV